MINNKIKSIDEIKDSKILYEKNIPLFGYILLSALIVIIITVVIWSNFAKKSYIVVATGILQGIEKNQVVSEFSGKIYDVQMNEGQYVKKGDLLFKIKSTDINMQLKQLKIQKETYENTAYKYGKLVDSIKNGKCYFSSNDKSDSVYYSQYMSYKSKLDQQIINKDELKEYKYTKKQIKREIENNKKVRKEMYYEAINSASASQKQYQDEVNAINSQISALKSGKKQYKIKASTDGNLHLLGDYKEGVVVQAGNPVASISDSSDNKAIIKATVSANDRSRIDIGDDVNIAVAGLQQNVYGTLKGKVTNIDTDISTTEDGQNAFFNVEIKPENTTLSSKDGEVINITNGMAVEARIIYDKITYFDYVMNAIGVKVAKY